MREYIVFTNREHYNDLGMIRSLGEVGIHPVLVAVRGACSFVGYSRYVKKKHYVKDAAEGLELIIREYSGCPEKSFILSGNDVITSLCDNHYDELKDDFYFYNAGSQGRINHFMNKDNMYELATRNGFSVPRTWIAKVGLIPDDVKYPVITKALDSLSTEWKNVVFICNGESEMKEAFSRMKSSRIMLQEYINKADEVSYQCISVNGGRQSCILTTMHQLYNIPDKYSPVWIVSNNEDKEIECRISNMIKDIRFEGIFEFEFIKDEKGKLWFLEINMRNAADGYATTVYGKSQVNLWCSCVERGLIPDEVYNSSFEEITAMAECFDYDVRVGSGLISRSEWYRQYRNAECKLYKGKRDIIPFIRFMIYKLTKMRQ